ncbi:hypothetical protein [Sphingobacterium sp.]|uniref:hypothetical protein n=1 Tax=Sphingobacterium sp. TaxID=341027 RepID=UPI0025845009|nr:hypothetical protein [Sphingobacterium sp.]WET67102.1 MAG: hypothetical protein P0Y57_14800 [Sphingobacterium sp.]
MKRNKIDISGIVFIALRQLSLLKEIKLKNLLTTRYLNTKNIYTLSILFPVIAVGTLSSCNKQIFDETGGNSQSTKVQGLISYAKENYSKRYGSTINYKVNYANPQWDKYKIQKIKSDSLIILIPLDKDNSYLVANQKAEDKDFMIVDSYGTYRKNLPSEFKKRVVLNNEQQRTSFKFVTNKITGESKFAKMRTPIRLKASVGGYWDCFEPEKYGNCIDGGDLPQVIVYPNYNKPDLETNWWWLKDMLNPQVVEQYEKEQQQNPFAPPAIKPDYYKAENILKNPIVTKKMNDVWKSTKDDVSKDKGRRERGFWIYYNKVTKEYTTGKEIVGKYVQGNSGTNGAVQPTNPEPPQNSVPVSFFHTHTPLTYVSPDLVRPAGFSEADIKFAINTRFDIIVIDYVGDMYPNGMYWIKGGHSIDAESRTYTYSPN